MTEIKTVGVIGAGQMGNGIAHVCALAGYNVLLNDVAPERTEEAVRIIERNMSRQVVRGVIDDAAMKAALGRIKTRATLEEIGQTDIAIGIAGLDPITSYIGQHDPHGHEFKVQAVCLADELAGAAELVKGNVSRVPVGVIRGLAREADDTASIAPVLRDQSRDLFR